MYYYNFLCYRIVSSSQSILCVRVCACVRDRGDRVYFMFKVNAVSEVLISPGHSINRASLTQPRSEFTLERSIIDPSST